LDATFSSSNLFTSFLKTKNGALNEAVMVCNQKIAEFQKNDKTVVLFNRKIVLFNRKMAVFDWNMVFL
jgi:hypothetical protein